MKEQSSDTGAWQLVPGRHVTARVLSHAPWGVSVLVAEKPDAPASVDAGLIDSPSGSPRALPHEYPPIGTDVPAVIATVDRNSSPAWLYLSMRAADLQGLARPCGFCGRATIISPGGDGIVMDVRSSAGPPSTCIPVHRGCLIDQLDAGGERARVAGVGHAS